MSSERWDVVLKALTGPMAAVGEKTYPGPVVRVGASPGPGQFELRGYRGIDARHCVITAYGEGEATVAPVGTNQVRLAPHPNVDWNQLEPISGPEYLSKGNAIHLGPVGRGVTLQFIECKRFGQWTKGRAGSDASAVQSKGVSASAGAAARKVAPQRSVRRIVAATAPIWVLGCLFIFVSVVGAGALGVYLALGPQVADLGPQVQGQDFYDSIDLTAEVDEKYLEGTAEPFRRFVAKPSADIAKRNGLVDTDHVTNPKEWDPVLFENSVKAMHQYLKAKAAFRRLEAVKEEWAEVLSVLRDEDLPDVFAAIPYIESRYKPDMQSIVCAKGWWQFMPEVAYRLDMRVQGCAITRDSGETVSWAPKAKTPPRSIRNAPYVLVNNGKLECRIDARRGCEIDERMDLEASTRGAAIALGEAFEDPAIAASGGAVQMTILSHNAGYDDSRFGRKKPYNVLPAYKRWSGGKSDEERHLFYGQMIKCFPKHDPKRARDDFCGSSIPPEAQHYVYPIVGVHFLAVCYYGKNYAGQFKPFEDWQRLAEDGYCQQYKIPTAQMVKSW